MTKPMTDKQREKRFREFNRSYTERHDHGGGCGCQGCDDVAVLRIIDRLREENENQASLLAEMGSKTAEQTLEIVKLRKVVDAANRGWKKFDFFQRFIDAMSDILEENEKDESKGGWDDCDLEWLLRRIKEEVEELSISYYSGLNRATIKECIDVANFCFFFHYNALRELDETEKL